MAKGVINLQKESGGVTKITSTDGITNTELVLPESGNIVSVDTAVTDNAIARYDGTTGKLQNSGVFVNDTGNVGIGVIPSAWRVTSKAIDIGASGNIESLTNNGSYISVNANNYNNGVNDIYINGTAATKYQQTAGTHSWFTAPSGISGNSIVWNPVMSLDSSGNMTLNNGNITSFGVAINVSDYSNSYTKLQRHYAPDETPNFINVVAGNVKSAILANGNFQSATNSYGSTSDIKLKENVVDTSPKLEKLMQVKVKNFNYIGEDQKQIGVIAQEIEQIFPSIVYETKDTKQVEVEKEREKTLEDGTVEIEKYVEKETVETGETTKNVKYSVIYMMMLKAMQEQQEIINDLKARIEQLELGVK